MIRIKTTSLAGLLVFAFAGNAITADLETAKGPVSIAATPAKIAVFDIAAIDTLDSLGIKIAGLPSNLYLPELAHLKDGSTVVGDIFEPNLEALSELQPDLIILGGRSSPQVEATSQVAPTIDMTMDGDDLLKQAKTRLSSYGALFGRQAEAETTAKALDAVVDKARAAVTGKGKALIIMTNGPKVTAYGPGSRFGWVHAALGLPAAVPDVEAATHGEAVSFEFIRNANPDWLLVLDRAAAIASKDQNAKATLDNELVKETTAWKKGQVIYLPAGDFYIAAGGVQAMSRVFTVITAAYSKAQ
ncbi:iron ABC transporter substrate-binding protein [Rhizobium sp. Root73]|uniref:siderophore ABC transporter substrate-binding protein n=1 Tax=unclassified Rhizobium TaxID=2613769 RepID=UPI000724C1E2|nr:MULTISPECIES: siderophore ABC transporter substrate-binding protein [unclassified Rhizobium]KQY00528.1 iron ABC transporter substrate-binding protein [Rhizobium sp. Root1334]KRC11712.1 iron ABC transporter substrate-binding protein [Rhizobium sp. Root73]